MILFMNLLFDFLSQKQLIYLMHCTVSFYLQTIGPNLDNAAVVKLKFIHSEKDTQFCEIYILDLSYVAMVKSTVEILQTFVAFSEYMNCKPNLGVFGRQF